ncbi:hypothetical protein GQ600_19424 [Phytophthora cactorum]|nr:hypothetical protein GQ600_19424 [Phytophthora cactorum]
MHFPCQPIRIMVPAFNTTRRNRSTERRVNFRSLWNSSAPTTRLRHLHEPTITVMRLLLWALLATLVILLSSCEVASVDTNKPLQRAQYSKLIS